MSKFKGVYDFIVKYLILVSHDGIEYDFSSHMVEFSYNENIFSQVTYGHILVLDALDYPSLLPIMGEERIKVSFTRPDELSNDYLTPIKFDMAVYKVSGRLNQNRGTGKAQTYTLHYASDDSYTNVSTKIFKKFRDMKYSEMVERIHAEYLPGSNIEIEETSGNYSYYAQNISPFSAINALAYRSISNDKNGYNYVFYRDRDGYKFKTISSLASKDPILSIGYGPKNISGNKINELYSVNDYSDDASIDTLRSAATGEGSSALLSVDPIRRKYYLQAFDLRGESGLENSNLKLLQNSDWKDFPHMHKNKNFIDNSRMFSDHRANLNMVITDFGHKESEYISARDADIYIHEPEYFLAQTKSHFNQTQTKVLSVTLSGHPGVRAGCTIDFKLPEVVANVGKQKSQELDRYIQGKYIVTQVSHILKNNQYKMNLKLVKDSYFKKIISRDPVKENQFIY